MSSNQQVVQEPTMISGWEMIPHPSFFQPSYTQEDGSEGLEGHGIPAIEADPIYFFNPETVNSSSKKRRNKGTAYEPLGIFAKEFTLYELFNSNDIEELNKGRETTLDSQQLLTYMKDWRIEKRRRIENNRNGRVDNIYHHPGSKRILRSQKEVRKFIEKNSHQRTASDNGEGSSQEPNVTFSSANAELFQPSCVNSSSLGDDLFQVPNVNIPSLGGDIFQDPNVNFSLQGGELLQDRYYNFSSLGGDLFHDPYFNLSSLGSEFYQDPNLNFYSSGGDQLLEHPNSNVSPSGGGLFQDVNANLSLSSGEMFQLSNVDIFLSGGAVFQDQLSCTNPDSRFHLQVYAYMIEGNKRQPQRESLRSRQASRSNRRIDVQNVEQVFGTSRRYDPGMGRSRLAGMSSSSRAHLLPQLQEPLYTQRQVKMLEARNRELAEQVRALEERTRTTQAQVDSMQTILRSSGITIPPNLGPGSTNEKR